MNTPNLRASLKKLFTLQRISEILAVSTISTFFLISLYAEITGNPNTILSVKTFILFAMPLMLIFMPTVTITGKKMMKLSDSEILKAKNSRIKWIALNGIGLMILAVLLYLRAKNHQLDTTFMILQITEFCFGIINISIFSLMIRDSFRIKKQGLVTK